MRRTRPVPAFRLVPSIHLIGDETGAGAWSPDPACIARRLLDSEPRPHAHGVVGLQRAVRLLLKDVADQDVGARVEIDG